MKKSIFVVAGVAMLALASCNKSYECDCVTGAGAEITSSVETHKGSDADEACAKGNSVLQLKVCVPKD